MTCKKFAIASGKGGVGKTISAINLGAALSEEDVDVVLIDGNIGMGDLGLLLGLEDKPFTLHDVLADEVNINEATYEKEGFKVVPSSLELKSYSKANPENLDLAYLEETSDCIIIDTPPGLNRELLYFLDIVDSVFSITTPTNSGILSGLKTQNIAKNVGSDIIGCIVNRVEGDEETEVNVSRIEKILGTDVLARIPEDENIKKANSYRHSVIDYNVDSLASQMYKRMANNIKSKI